MLSASLGNENEFSFHSLSSTDKRLSPNQNLLLKAQPELNRLVANVGRV